MTELLTPIIILSSIGIISGLVLGIASVLMAVPVDERVEKIKTILPGANCGACGYPGCDGFAHALMKQEVPINGCPPGGEAVVHALAEVLEIDSVKMTQQIAVVHCYCDDLIRMGKLNYEGINTCTYASQIFGGPTACYYACQGFGDCIEVCAYNAIRIEDGLAVIDRDLCMGCTLCVTACPKNILKMAPKIGKAIIHCSSIDWGPGVQGVCPIGCVACNRCVKVCTMGAITIEHYLARVDYEICNGCGACVEVCPKKIIRVGS